MSFSRKRRGCTTFLAERVAGGLGILVLTYDPLWKQLENNASLGPHRQWRWMDGRVDKITASSES
jgi:hypothetical protein